MKDLRIGRRGKSYVIQDYSNNRKQLGSKFKYFKDAKLALKKLTLLSYFKKDLDLDKICEDMQKKYLIKRLMLSVNA